MSSTADRPLFWALFLAGVLVLLIFDLGLFHRRAEVVRLRRAAAWSGLMVVLSAAFGLWVFSEFGRQKGLEFFAGYLIEYALSVDNIFVFILIFGYFSVPARFHHRVLFWGILGALMMRAALILAGTALLQAFHWIIYLFGAFLIYAGLKVFRQGENRVEPQHNPLVRAFRRLIPMSSGHESGRLVIRERGKWMATPLALVLVTVETTDVVFALDSIPAIFAVTRDPFIVYTSNVCAILGLRSMYFMLAAVVDRFVYLGAGLGIVLMFVGTKMLLSVVYPISIGVSLSFVAAILVGSVLLSLWRPGRRGPVQHSKPD